VDVDTAFFKEALGGAGGLRVFDAEDLDAGHSSILAQR
jgi:hypothetical protein